MTNAAQALRDAADVINRASVDFVTDYQIRDLCPEIVGGPDVPAGVAAYLRRRANEIDAKVTRKSELPPGSVIRIIGRLAVKREDTTSEYYAWRYVDTGALVDEDTVRLGYWTLV